MERAGGRDPSGWNGRTPAPGSERRFPYRRAGATHRVAPARGPAQPRDRGDRSARSRPHAAATAGIDRCDPDPAQPRPRGSIGARSRPRATATAGIDRRDPGLARDPLLANDARHERPRRGHPTFVSSGPTAGSRRLTPDACHGRPLPMRATDAHAGCVSRTPTPDACHGRPLPMRATGARARCRGRGDPVGRPPRPTSR